MSQKHKKRIFPPFTPCLRNLIALVAVALFPIAANAQTPGLIYEPATGGGAAVLDPNGDGYTSSGSAGFATNDQTQSELPYAPFIFPGEEPLSDVSSGPACGFTDFVDEG